MALKSVLALVIVAFPAVGMAQSQEDSALCGSLQNAYGPFDYTNFEHFNEKLPIVEEGHFDAGVEQLIGHQRKAGGADMLVGDLDYTLRAFPNHHRALYAMVRYFIERVPNGERVPRYSMECYFDRAIRFVPNDAVVRMLQGIYYMRSNQSTRAQVSLESALRLAPESAEIHYNAGLLYVDLGEYDLALHHAHRAYELGYPLMGLRRKLERLGQWRSESPGPQSESDGNS